MQSGSAPAPGLRSWRIFFHRACSRRGKTVGQLQLRLRVNIECNSKAVGKSADDFARDAPEFGDIQLNRGADAGHERADP